MQNNLLLQKLWHKIITVQSIVILHNEFFSFYYSSLLSSHFFSVKQSQQQDHHQRVSTQIITTNYLSLTLQPLWGSRWTPSIVWSTALISRITSFQFKTLTFFHQCTDVCFTHSGSHSSTSLTPTLVQWLAIVSQAVLSAPSSSALATSQIWMNRLSWSLHTDCYCATWCVPRNFHAETCRQSRC